MIVVGLPQGIKGAESLTFSLERNDARPVNPLGNTVQNLIRSGYRWRAGLHVPLRETEDSAVLAAWLDQVSRGDRQLYLTPPQNSVRGNWNPAELIVNGTLLNGVTSGWTAENSTLSVNARRLKVQATSTAAAYAKQQLSGAEANKPHVVIADFMPGSGTTGALEIIDSAYAVIEQSQQLTFQGRAVVLYYPSSTTPWLRVTCNDGVSGHDTKWNNISSSRCLLVNGGGQTGTSLNVDGGPVSINAALKVGEFVTLRTKNQWQMVRLTEDFDTDASGNGVLRFEPALRYAPLDGAPIIVRNPFTRFMMANDVSAAAINVPILGSYNFEVVEDPTAQTGEMQDDLLWAWDAENLSASPTQGFGSDIAMVHASSTGTAYNVAGARVAFDVNRLRFNYDPVTHAVRGLRIEAAKTNFALRSDEFDNAAWTKAACTITANAFGTMDALVEDTTTTDHNVNQSTGQTAAQNYCASYDLVSVNRRYAIVKMVGVDAVYAYFDLQTGTVSQAAASTGANMTNLQAFIEPGPNGSWRCSVSATKAASGTVVILVEPSTTSTGGQSSSYLGTGVVALYVGGAQLEVGSIPTTAIATAGSTTTRNQDLATITGISGYNQAAGTLYVEAYAPPVQTGVNVRAAEIGADINNAIGINRNATDGKAHGSVVNAGVTQADLTYSAWTVGALAKAIIAWAVNDIAGDSDGGTIQTDTSASLPNQVSTYLGRDSSGGDANCWNQDIKRIRIYGVRKPNQFMKNVTA